MKETIFKVGDKVFTFSEGWGEVHIVQNNIIDIDFEISKIRISVLEDFVSFTEYDLVNGGFSHERPKKEPEIGSLCLFSDNGEEFRNNIGYVDFLLEKAIDYTAKDGSYWRFCKQIEIKDV